MIWDTQNQNANKEKQYKKKDLLGSGTFGKVYKCLNTKKGKNEAIKVIENASLLQHEAIEYEAEAMMKAKSDNTVPLIDYYYDNADQSYVFVMPYYKKGNLKRQIEKQWSRIQILCFLSQVCEAFVSIQHAACWHLDLKPDNIILKNDGQYLVCDFGCAKLLGGDSLQTSSRFISLSMGRGVGTTRYAAPEVILNVEGGKYSDMWSLGIILYQILYKCHPLFEKIKQGSNTSVVKKFKEGKIIVDYPSKPGYEDIIDICKEMLKPEKRLDWKELKVRIHGCLKIPKNTPIIYSIQNLINYVQNVSRVVLGLVYYINMNAQHLQDLGLLAKAQKISFYSKAFIYLLYDQVESAIILPENSPTVQFFLFPQIKGNLKIQEKQKLLHLAKNAKDFTKQEYKRQGERNLTNMKMNFNCQIEAFGNQIKQAINGEQKKTIPGDLFNPIYQWNKIVEICAFITNNNQKLTGLNYADKDKIADFAHKIVYE